MTPLEMTTAVLDHAIANWNTADAALTFDGERFDAPEGEPWIRLTIRDLPTASVTLGARSNRLAERRATLIAQVFAPLEVSDGAGAALAGLRVDVDRANDRNAGAGRRQPRDTQPDRAKPVAHHTDGHLIAPL